MSRIVHSVLSMRAATLDLTTRPAPYQVLVAWCCSRGALHAAATALIGHLSRLQQAKGDLQEQHGTLGRSECEMQLQVYVLLMHVMWVWFFH